MQINQINLDGIPMTAVASSFPKLEIGDKLRIVGETTIKDITAKIVSVKGKGELPLNADLFKDIASQQFTIVGFHETIETRNEMRYIRRIPIIR